MTKKIVIAMLVGIAFLGFNPKNASASYGCLANNAHYACSSQGKPDCSDVTSGVCQTSCFTLDNAWCSGTLTVKLDKTTAAPNDTVTISVSFPPPGWFGTVSINNGGSKTFSSNTYSLAVTSANGFNLSGSNTVLVKIFGGNNGALLPVQGGPNFSVTVSSAAATTKTTTPADKTETTPSVPVYNPLGVDTIEALFLSVLKYLLGLIGTVAVAVIIYGGFRMVASRGSEEAFTSGRKTVTYAVIGLAVAVLSFSLVAIIQNVLNAKIQ